MRTVNRLVHPVLLALGMVAASTGVWAEQHAGAGGPQKAMHDSEHRGKGPRQHKPGDGRRAHERGSKCLMGPHWTASLTGEQRAELDRLKVDYAKEKLPLKARARAIKMELTVLSLVDEVDEQAVAAKLDELMEIKRAKMQAKYSYIAAKRGVLTPDQRASFDMETLRKARKGKRRHHAKGGDHHAEAMSMMGRHRGAGMGMMPGMGMHHGGGMGMMGGMGRHRGGDHERGEQREHRGRGDEHGG